MQGSFGRLRILLEVNHSEKRANLLETCVQLNNLCAACVGLNQIQSVYMPIWQKDAEGHEVWMNFKNMLFSDQQKKDRVS